MSSAPSKGRNDLRRVVINDASCFIDLRKVDLLRTILQLPYSFAVVLPVVENELLEIGKAEWRQLETAGLTIVDLDSERVTRAFELRKTYPVLSAEDCFSLSLAERTENCVLLTGDKGLRKTALTFEIDAHGILWVIDELVRFQVTPPKILLGCLEKWSADPLVWLPEDEIAARIRLLTKG
jgi:rRNA-processing protein FCF1